jgi:hypothetical protein
MHPVCVNLELQPPSARSPRPAVRSGVRAAVPLGLAFLLLGSPASSGQAPESVPAELIVVFHRETAEALLRAEAHTDPAKRSELAKRVQALGGAPVEIRQFLSGGGLLVGLDRGAVQDRVARALRAEPGVVDVRLEPPEPAQKRLHPPPATLVVSFAPGSAAAAMLRGGGGCAGRERIPEWVAAREERIGVPLVCAGQSERELRLQVDWDRLTATVMERLQRLEQIDYVEPNRVLVPFPRDGY